MEAAVRAAAAVRLSLAAALLAGATVTAPAFLVAAQTPSPTPAPTVAAADPAAVRTLPLRVKPLPRGVRKVSLETDGKGHQEFVLSMVDGRTERLRPAQFASLLDGDTRGRSWLFALLNITGPLGFAWVALGLLGQVLFGGRMVLQWLVSERRKRSVVPVGFWWMSLGGATMLLVYFSWRRDIIGVLGQSTGWLIYVRNLWLIYRERWWRRPAVASVVATLTAGAGTRRFSIRRLEGGCRVPTTRRPPASRT